MKFINKFVEHYPDISVRQVTMRLAIKDCRLCEERLKVRNELLATETEEMETEIEKGKGGGSKKRKLETASPKFGGKTSPKPFGSSTKKVSSGLKKKPRVTSQGNKRMSIPMEIFPEFCRRIGATGTAQRTKLRNKFVLDCNAFRYFIHKYVISAHLELLNAHKL